MTALTAEEITIRKAAKETEERAVQVAMQAELENAIELAVASHQGQRDKQGQPYILHCLRVMLAVAVQGATDLLPAAVLHDVVEDTGVTPDELPDHGMSTRTVGLLWSLTRLDGESYTSYIERVAMDRQASIVKLADLHDNMGGLWKLPDQYEARRLAARYDAAITKLTLAHNL